MDFCYIFVDVDENFYENNSKRFIVEKKDLNQWKILSNITYLGVFSSFKHQALIPLSQMKS